MYGDLPGAPLPSPRNLAPKWRNSCKACMQETWALQTAPAAKPPWTRCNGGNHNRLQPMTSIQHEKRAQETQSRRTCRGPNSSGSSSIGTHTKCKPPPRLSCTWRTSRHDMRCTRRRATAAHTCSRRTRPQCRPCSVQGSRP